ncbi:MAG: hypothetical protein ACI4WG_00375 [Erysipelotrichaceae bacterium]
MFRRATEQDKRVIFDLYAKQSVISDSQDDYFNCSFVARNTIVNEINGHVVASLQVDYHKVMFNDLPIVASVVFAQFADRSKGSKHLESLRAEAIKQESYKSLFTFINCDNNKEYQKYGFDAVYYKRAYSINKKDFKEISYSGVSKDFDIDELLNVYRSFTEKFTGYFYRDRNYYVSLIDLLQNKRGNLACCYDSENKCVGYMIYFIDSTKVIVKELVYLNGYALSKLLSYCLRIKEDILVYVSNNEDLTKVFPKVTYKKVISTLVKVNDYELFNKLFACKVTSSLTAFKQDKRPLFLSDIRYM